MHTISEMHGSGRRQLIYLHLTSFSVSNGEVEGRILTLLCKLEAIFFLCGSLIKDFNGIHFLWEAYFK